MQHQRFLEAEVRKFRRWKLVQFHQLEQNLPREELNKRQGEPELLHVYYFLVK